MKRSNIHPRRLALLATLAACTASGAFAQQSPTYEAGDPRGVMVEEVRNDMPSFMVRVDVDKPDRVYRDGELMQVRVISERPGYLYLLYCDAEQNITCLFPNTVNRDNSIAAGQPVIVPAPGSRFGLRICPPFGQEVLKAIVSLSPLTEEQLQSFASTKASTKTKIKGVKGVKVELAKQAGGWAEHHVITQTVPAGGAAPLMTTPTVPPSGTPPGTQPGTQPGTPAVAMPAGSRRVGVFIGISDFLDPSIRDLKVCHKDAQTMADVMRTRCGLTDAVVLLNEQATLRNIGEMITRRLPAATSPGDTVIIYWSGHGARCSDNNGDEKDGYDEYLVPYDGRLTDLATIRRTMLLDDAFGRWVQELDGRKLVVILDTCHSGGQNEREKSLAKGLGDPGPVVGGVKFDFLDGEMNRTKDIGQKETALLASSRATQVSFERREGDLSIMTYCLWQQLASGAGPLTLDGVFQALKQQVAAYVEQTFPGTTQTPVLINNTTPPLYLRR